MNKKNDESVRESFNLILQDDLNTVFSSFIENYTEMCLAPIREHVMIDFAKNQL